MVCLYIKMSHLGLQAPITCPKYLHIKLVGVWVCSQGVAGQTHTRRNRQVWDLNDDPAELASQREGAGGFRNGGASSGAGPLVYHTSPSPLSEHGTRSLFSRWVREDRQQRWTKM